MIKNKRQLKMTRTQLEKFKHHLTLFPNEKETSLLIEAEKNAVISQIKELEDQIQGYELLWNSRTPIPILNSIGDIPRALIQARISLGLNQGELGKRIGLKEQQIQRYEATDYEAASLSRINEFVDVLNLELSDDIQPLSEYISLNKFIKRMREAGLERRFILKRLLPPKVLDSLLTVKKRISLQTMGIQVIDHIRHIFNWTTSEVLGQKTLTLNTDRLGNVLYKVPKRISAPRLSVYTFYTHYLASLIQKATQHLSIEELPTNPIQIHKIMLEKYGSITIENTLKYVWSLGIPVISIDDPGAFHGAFFREKGRNIIILKHRTKSDATWLFSLFHEFWHASKHQKDPEIELLVLEDFEDPSITEKEQIEEEEANLFAGAVLLGKPTDPLIHQCLEEADYKLQNLKLAVLKIARKENVPVDVLANCVAFKVSQDGKNWWGPAQNLQVERYDIQRIARDILLDYVDLSQISGLDLDLLRRALRNFEGN